MVGSGVEKMFEKNNHILNQLNTICEKNMIKVDQMNFFVEYPVLSIKKSKIVSRERIILELDRNQLILPMRYNSLSDDVFIEINNGGYTVMNLGNEGGLQRNKLVFYNKQTSAVNANDHNYDDDDDDGDDENDDGCAEYSKANGNNGISNLHNLCFYNDTMMI